MEKLSYEVDFGRNVGCCFVRRIRSISRLGEVVSKGGKAYE